MTDPDAPCDLHVHSYYSDGMLSPGELVNRAGAAGLAVVAVADHDTLAGQGEAIEAGRLAGVEVVTAVEFSLIEDDRDVHLLGYLFDPENEELVAALAGLATARNERARAMVEKIREAGVPLSFESVAALATRGTVGRPHVARALLDMGAIGSFNEAFSRFIGANGPAFVPKRVLSLGEVVSLVTRAGGVTVWAHPGRLVSDEALLGRMVAAGVRGLEATHPNHSGPVETLISETAAGSGLVATGGSDFHFAEAMKADIGESTVPYSVVEALREAAGRR